MNDVVATGWQRALRIAAIVLVFVLVGPFIGLFAFAAGIAIYGLMTTEPLDMAAMAAATAIYGLFLAHFFGGVPALLTGIVVAAWTALRRRLISCVAGGLVGGGVGALYFRVLLSGADGMTLEPMVATVLVVMASVIAGAVCTRLTRRWQG